MHLIPLVCAWLHNKFGPTVDVRRVLATEKLLLDSRNNDDQLSLFAYSIYVCVAF
jgi:hypothetical protein